MEGTLAILNQWVTDFNSFLWGTLFLIPLLVGTGIFYTFKLKFVQVRKFPLAVRYLCGGATLFGKRADKTGMSSFQALTTAIAAQVGTGNVAGTATAMVMGGAGAIFWLWCAAFLAWQPFLRKLSWLRFIKPQMTLAMWLAAPPIT